MFRRALFIVLIVGLVLTGLVLTAIPSQAGTNGQQLRMDITCQYAPVVAEIEVSGLNQRGERVTWSSKPNSKGINTYGWWWVGSVFIKYKYAGINPYTGSAFDWYGVYAYVPKSFNKDFYPVPLDSYDDCSPAWTP